MQQLTEWLVTQNALGMIIYNPSTLGKELDILHENTEKLKFQECFCYQPNM